MKFILLFVLGFASICVNAHNKVLLGNVNVLTLNKDQQTSYRRTSPISQLNCIGGEARSHSHKVETVQCKNTGFNGKDYSWECKADLPTNLKLGKLSVSCEGYDYPDDPYVLVGSCGLKYNLEYNQQSNTQYNQNNRQNVNHQTRTTTTTHYPHHYRTNYTADFISTLIVLSVIVFLCVICFTPRTRSTYISTPSSYSRVPLVSTSTIHTPVSTVHQPVTTIHTPIVTSPNIIVAPQSTTSAYVDGMVMGSILSHRPSSSTHTHTHTETSSYAGNNNNDNSYFNFGSGSGSSYDSGSTHTSTSFGDTERR